MEKWRFFPILVKENIVNNMSIRDIVIFAKCSKKCQNLLTVVPIHLPSTLIDVCLFVGLRHRLSAQHVGSFVNFSILATSRKFYIDQLKLNILTEESENEVKDFIEKLKKARNSLKVKELSMVIEVDHEELITGILSVCDPSRIESIEIPKLYSQEVYDEIVKTPQWINSKRVSLNCIFYQRLTMPNVNFDDFLHFESVQLLVERLDTDDLVKFIQNFCNSSEHARFVIQCREPMQQDLIRQKIEAGWVGNWQQNLHTNTVFVIDPAKPDHVFDIYCSSYFLHGGWSLLHEFNERQRFIQDLFVLH
ncbi:unnamed protein product [Caenorhabditis brenneri]